MRNSLKLAAVVVGAGMVLCARNVQAGRISIPFALTSFHTPLLIDNPYSPMPPGLRVVFSEVSVDECVANEVVVTSDSKSDFQGAYAGLTARVVTDQAWLDEDCDGGHDLLLEDTFDWFAQDDAGNVWYVGEDTTAYEYDDEGNLLGSSKEGSWQAGSDGAVAGLIMLAQPTAGTSYRQEFAIGIAQDLGKVIGTNRAVTTGLGSFTGCLVTKEWSPLSPGSIEHKYYCPDAGLVLVREFHGKTTVAEAVEIDLP